MTTPEFKRSCLSSIATSLIIAIVVSGCALAVPSSFVSPAEVKLDRAFVDIACGLKTYQNEQSKLGLNTLALIDTVDVNFVLKASADGQSTLVIDAKPAVPANLFTALGFNYTDNLRQVGERTNTIKITLKNMYTASLNDPGKITVKRDGPPLGLGPRAEVPLVDPCNSVEDVYTTEQIRAARLQASSQLRSR